MKRVKRKLRSAGGVTMVEMLCATIILVLLCLVMNAGIQLAMDSYLDVTAESETQLLLSTLADALSDKLRYAVVTETGDGAPKSSAGEVSVDTNGMVTVGGNALLPAGAYRKGKYIAELQKVEIGIIKDASDTPTDCYFTIGLKVKEKEASGGGDAISAETELTVRCLTPQSCKEGTTP